MTNASWWSSNATVDDLVHVSTTVLDINSTAAVSTTSVEWGAVALSLVVVATVFGNSLLCAAVVTEKRLQNMTNFFLASLAVADLLVAVVVMPLAVVVQIYGTPLRSPQTWNWVIGSPAQWVIWVIFHVLVTGSSF